VRTYLLEPESRALCREVGLPVTRFSVAVNLREALRSAQEIGYPVVLKVISPQVMHKSEVGGVFTNLRGPNEVKKAYREILANVTRNRPDAEIVGVQVEEMAPASTEVIIGAVRNPQFGPVIAFGLGGVLVEVLRDVSFRVAPIASSDAREMMAELKGYQILKGYRGLPRADLHALEAILLRVSMLVIKHPEICEADLNPVLVYEKGAKVVDAKIMIEELGPSRRQSRKPESDGDRQKPL